MRNTFDFDNGVRITSDFESGNLLQCLEFAPETSNEIPSAYDVVDENAEGENQGDESNQGYSQPNDDSAAANDQHAEAIQQVLFGPSEDELHCYDLFICPDSLPYVEGVKQRAQFYFSVTGVPAQRSMDQPRTLRFRVINESNQGRLLSYGHKPVYLIVPHKEFLAI